MLAERSEIEWPPGRAPPTVPGWWNNFLIPREEDCDESWTVYPINRVGEYLRLLDGDRTLRMIRMKFVPALSWPEWLEGPL